MPADPSLVSALIALLRYEPVTGACLLYSNYIVADNLPCSDKKMNLICGTVAEMCDGYQSVGRDISEYYFGYDECQFYVLSLGAIRLIIVTDLTALPDQIGLAGRQFVQQNQDQLEQLKDAELTQKIKLPPPKKPPSGTTVDEHGVAASVLIAEEEPEAPERWHQYRDKLHTVLARALGSAQSARLIDRVLVDHGYRKQVPLKQDFGSIGRAVIDRVPNRSRRRGLKPLVEEIVLPR